MIFSSGLDDVCVSKLRVCRAVTMCLCRNAFRSALDDASAVSSELLGLREALVAAGERLEQVSQQRRAAEQDAAELRQTMDEQRGALSGTEAKVRQLEEQLLAAQQREQEQNRHLEQLQQQQQQQQQHTAAEPAGVAEIASLQQQLSSVLQELNDLQFHTDQDKAVAAMELQRLTEALSAAQEGQAAQAAGHQQMAELQQRVQELADTAAESEGALQRRALWPMLRLSSPVVLVFSSSCLL